ncbi:MAG: hypothetical protein N2V78_12660 [Methanophagales archaeon]|nr:hypothetical protein [Methanophagales archaeon]
MVEFEKCFIMLCTNATEDECLRRNLFGDLDWRLQYLRGIKTGDIGLLLNVSKDEVIGIFRARSEPQLNIVPDAWGGKFPVQVRVEPIGKIQRIRGAASIFEKIGIKMIEEKIKSCPRSVDEEQLRRYKEWGKKYGNIA